jgi:hypothetical protein
MQGCVKEFEAHLGTRGGLHELCKMTFRDEDITLHRSLSKMTEDWNGGLRHLVLRTRKNRPQSGRGSRNRIKALLHTAEGKDSTSPTLSTVKYRSLRTTLPFGIGSIGGLSVMCKSTNL